METMDFEEGYQNRQEVPFLRRSDVIRVTSLRNKKKKVNEKGIFT